MPVKTSQNFTSATLRWSRKSKPRPALSSNMISAPLGDFRHVSHLGLNDSFGDVSAFQRSSSLILRGSLSDQNLYVMGPPPPKPPRLLTPEEAAAQARSSISPAHKKSHSLPLLDDVEVVEVAMELPCRDNPRDEADRSAGPNAALAPKGQWSSLSPLAMDDLPLSLNLDLGPSILDDVLKVMDNQ